MKTGDFFQSKLLKLLIIAFLGLAFSILVIYLPLFISLFFLLNILFGTCKKLVMSFVEPFLFYFLRSDIFFNPSNCYLQRKYNLAQCDKIKIFNVYVMAGPKSPKIICYVNNNPILFHQKLAKNQKIIFHLCYM